MLNKKVHKVVKPPYKAPGSHLVDSSSLAKQQCSWSFPFLVQNSVNETQYSRWAAKETLLSWPLDYLQGR